LRILNKSPNDDLLKRLRRARKELVIELVRRGAFPRSVLRGAPYDELATEPAFIPALAYCDRQLAIHAVINADLSDVELARLALLLNLQSDGHLLRQLRVAAELEQERRHRGGFRSRGNVLSTQRG